MVYGSFSLWKLPFAMGFPLSPTPLLFIVSFVQLAQNDRH